jgi:hypothetical protein
LDNHLGNDTRVYGPREIGELTSVSKSQVEWMGYTNNINIIQRNHKWSYYMKLMKRIYLHKLIVKFAIAFLCSLVLY